jgi:hypothetical protein
LFYGVREWLLETLTASFAVHLSHQTNGATGITPTCRVTMTGHTIFRGLHVKVMGEKGTLLPKSLWDRMYVDTEFEATMYLQGLVQEDDTRVRGKWEFLLTPESTKIELMHFTRKTKGGMISRLYSRVHSARVKEARRFLSTQQQMQEFGH